MVCGGGKGSWMLKRVSMSLFIIVYCLLYDLFIYLFFIWINSLICLFCWRPTKFFSVAAAPVPQCLKWINELSHHAIIMPSALSPLRFFSAIFKLIFRPFFVEINSRVVHGMDWIGSGFSGNFVHWIGFGRMTVTLCFSYIRIASILTD